MRIVPPLILAILALTGAESLRAEDVHAERTAVYENAKQLFAARDWKTLEALAEEYRTQQSRFTDGRWKLFRFCTGLSVEAHLGRDDPDEKWEQWLNGLADWEAAYPDSILLTTVRTEFWTKYAWKARGGGWANTVTDKGWDSFRERLMKARNVSSSLQAKLGVAIVPCPRFYEVLQPVALGQSWQKKEALGILHTIMQNWPDYHAVYSDCLYYLEPKWYGSHEEQLEVMEAIYRKDPGGHGAEMYARLALNQGQKRPGYFDHGGVDLAKVREGLNAMVTRFPDSSYNQFLFLRFALLIDDWDAVTAIAPHLDPTSLKAEEHDDADVAAMVGWQSGYRYWIEQGMPRHLERVATLYPGPPSKLAHKVAVSPDGTLLAVSFDGGGCVLLDLLSRETKWAEDLGYRFVTMAFSPDGRHFATGLKDTGITSPDDYEPVSLWPIDPHRGLGEPVRVGAFETVTSLVFSDDGEELYIAAGNERPTDPPGPSLAQWKLHEPDFRTLLLATSKSKIGVQRFTDGGNTLLFSVGSNHQLTRDDDFAAATQVGAWVRRHGFCSGLVPSANGKWLISTHNRGWNFRFEASGTVAVIDRKTNRQRPAATGDLPLSGINDVCVLQHQGEPLVVTAGHDGFLLFWEGLESGQLKLASIFPASTTLIWAIAAVPHPEKSGVDLVTAAQDGTVTLWKWDSRAEFPKSFLP